MNFEIGVAVSLLLIVWLLYRLCDLIERQNKMLQNFCEEHVSEFRRPPR